MQEENLLEQRKDKGGRPKLLFLAYYFPPLNSTGCVRTWNIAKYLARSGWHVTVVTPDPSLWRKTDSSNRVDMDLDREGIRRLTTRHRWCCLSPWDLKCWDGYIGRLCGGMCRKIARYLGIDALVVGWAREVESACAALTKDDVDLLLASGPPFVSFQLAKSLSERLGCPYVLDYRDPWVVRHSKARQVKVPVQEKGIVEASSVVTVISPSLLNGRLELGSKLNVITNGFDPDELAGVRAHRFGHFAIVYTGTFYFPVRTVTPLMQALKCLKEEQGKGRAEWKFHYYGPHGDHVRQEAERWGVTEKVVLHGSVARDEALAAVRGAGLAVVITALQAEVPGKLYEALGMRVPTLVIGPSGGDVDSVTKTAGLAHRIAPDNIEGMADFIREVMSGKAPLTNSPETYAWPNLIESLNALLRKAAGADSRSVGMGLESFMATIL
jgi:glycosyltransferase involved in cell wall biosynthesis